MWENLMENQIFCMLVAMAILVLALYFSYKISGFYEEDKEKYCKKKTKDESDLEVK